MTVGDREPEPELEYVAGETPGGPTPARQWVVFLVSLLITGALILLVLFAIELPDCEAPPSSWAPCIGP
ncbi:hypothetical protein [Citricoccus nitrophenolicus]|uniref:hypothetical protein n=1 Tax=Citricoccus nitrophenolicus TaxID=863575 RepID=UPI0031E73DE4